MTDGKGVITEISVQKRHKDRVNLSVDGEFFAGVPAIVVLERRMKVGDEVNVRELMEITLAADREKCFTKGTAYATRGMHTEREVRENLLGKGFSMAVVDETIEKMKGYGFIDDAAYIRAYVELYIGRNGRKKILYDCKNKGLDQKAVAAAIDALGGTNEDGEEYEGAYRVAEKYMRNKPLDLAGKQKLNRHLYAKGYGFELINAVVDRLKRAREDEDEADGGVVDGFYTEPYEGEEV